VRSRGEPKLIPGHARRIVRSARLAQKTEGAGGHIVVGALWSITENVLRNAARWRSWGSRRIACIFWKWPKPGKLSPTCTKKLKASVVLLTKPAISAE
jgi:hypothetical protein